MVSYTWTFQCWPTSKIIHSSPLDAILRDLPRTLPDIYIYIYRERERGSRETVLTAHTDDYRIWYNKRCTPISTGQIKKKQKQSTNIKRGVINIMNIINDNTCPWCSGYRRWKWTRRHEFKSWTRLIAFHIALIPLGKVWIQLLSLQLWVNSRADWFLQPWWGN